MGYWGWRPILVLLFLHVWVTGCITLHPIPPQSSPTNTPLSTLTVQDRGSPSTTLPPTPTLIMHQPVSPSPTPSPTLGHLALAPTSPALSAVQQQGQACYDLPTKSLICMGIIHNPLEEVLVNVHLRVGLMDEMGELLQWGESYLEQSVLLPGASTVYSVRFQENWEGYSGAISLLNDAGIKPLTAEPDFIGLAANVQAVTQNHIRYRVQTSITNHTAIPAKDIQLTLVLLDEQGRVNSYRILRLDIPLKPGEAYDVEIEAYAHTYGIPLSHELYAFGRAQYLGD